MLKLQNIKNIVLILCICLIAAANAFAQTTAFTYQGRFTDASVAQPTNGTYAMSFKLFDAPLGGNQVGATVNLPAVQVVNGIFTVQLDYTAASFDGTTRYLEITVTNTVLNPRQEITNAPYAITAQNALTANRAGDSTRLGGIVADQYVQTNDLRLSDDRNPLAGSANYVQNQTAVSQPANLNINGNATIGGTVSGNVVDAGTQFNLGGNRFLSGGGGNVFAGINAGTANTTGGDNSFFGTNAGKTNSTGFNNAFFGTDAGRNNNGASNSFFGRSAGFANTTGGNNSFFGLDSGRFNTTGGNNAFFGFNAGSTNTQGSDNAFFGLNAGFSNTIGSQNSFVGRNSGVNNTSGSTNSFFGTNSGITNTAGGNNTALGNQADFAVNNLFFATAIGAGSVVSTSNTIALGRSNGNDTVVIFGLGAAGGTALCRNASNQISTCTAGGGGGSFINNSTVLQPTSNFNISGGGTIGGTLSANIVNSTTTYRIGNANVFGTPNQTSVVAGQLSNYTLVGSNSAFFGFKAGQSANGFSQANTFIGSESGELTTSGGNNTFVGKDAGFFNISGSLNSFFGSSAGKSNTTADANSFFGYESGLLNSTGTRNAFFGFQSGRQSATVSDNSFFGYQAGTVTTGGSNSFFGSLAGAANTGGINNTFVGSGAGEANTNGTENTYLGFQSGSGNGSKNTVIGSGTSADGNQNTVIGENSSVSGDFNTSIGTAFFASGNNNTLIGYFARTDTSQFPVNNSTAIGVGAVVNSSNTVVLGTDQDLVRIPGNLNVSSSIFASSIKASFFETTGGMKLTAINSFTNTGNTPLCRNSNNLISNCPPNFADNSAGFTKELTAQIETQAAQIKEQQTQIATQAEQIKLMQTQMEALKETVCAMNPAAKICGK